MYASDTAPNDRVDHLSDASDVRNSVRSAPVDGIEAVEVFNPGGQAPVLILSDHSGCNIPAYLGNLGLPEDERRRHIGWDIGATDMTRRLASLLDAPAVLNHVSRLVVDPNRDPYSPSSIPAVADGTFVPGNQDLSLLEQQRRLRLSFIPYHRAISKEIARMRQRVGIPAIIAMHSFTPAMQRQWRPWEAGVLFGDDDRLALPVLERLRLDTSLCVGANQPYSGRHPDSYSLQFHALRTGFPNVAFEVRQDQVSTQSDAKAWADRLAQALQPALSDPTLYRRWGSWRRLVDDDYAAVTNAGGRRRIPAG